MRVPVWLTCLVAAVVISFGVYRVRLFLLGAQRYAERAGRSPMYRIARRTHLLMGVVFLLLGGWMLATAFGL